MSERCLCPFKMSNPNTLNYCCERSFCMWWHRGNCVIVSIAETLREK